MKTELLLPLVNDGGPIDKYEFMLVSHFSRFFALIEKIQQETSNHESAVVKDHYQYRIGNSGPKNELLDVADFHLYQIDVEYLKKTTLELYLPLADFFSKEKQAM